MKEKNCRAVQHGTFYLLLTALSLVILILLNLIAEKLPASWTQKSISQTAVLELSEQAETFLRTVDQDVVVYWIVRGGQEDIYLERFLARVSELNTRIEVEKTDPVLHPGILSQYTSGSVDQNSLIAVCGQKSKYIGYGEIYVRGSDEDSAVRLCAESALCAAIRSVTTQQTPSVCLLTGHGEQSLPERFTAQLTAQGYRLSTLDLLSSDGIPADCDCLLVCGAAQDLTEAELMQLTAYLQDGGRLCLFSRYLDESTPNWNALLAGYGLSAVPGLVAEAQSGSYADGYPYYLLPQILTADATRELRSASRRVMLPLCQAVQPSDSMPEGISQQLLFASSAYAYSKQAGFSMQTTQREEGDASGPFYLAASAEKQEQSGVQSALCWFPSAYILDDTVNTTVSDGNLYLLLDALQFLLDSGAAVPPGPLLGGERLTVGAAALGLWAAVCIAVLPLGLAVCGWAYLRRRKRR